MSRTPEIRRQEEGIITRTFEPPSGPAPVVPLPGAQPVPPLDFSPTPFQWRDPATIPPRDWLYGKSYIRQFVSVTVAPGGLGKSRLAIGEAISMAIGRGLLGQWVKEPLRVWLWNLEDPQDELDRMAIAAMLYHRIPPEALGGRLFLDTGRVQSLCTAITDKAGHKILRPVMDRLESEIKRLGIDVLIIDPFVSSHQVSENDNNAIDAVAKEWARLADRCNISVQLIHHTRKTSGEVEATAESSRGAKALVDAARDVRTLNRMTKEEAAKADVDNHRLFFRVYSDKGNLAPPAEASKWYRLEDVELGNGDHVGVVAEWEWPDALDGITAGDVLTAQRAVQAAGDRNRQSVQSEEWVGHVIGEALSIPTGHRIQSKNLDEAEKKGRAKVQRLLSTWTASGAFIEDKVKDTKGATRPILKVGEWAV